MQFLTSILPFAKVLGVFALMLLGIRLKLGLAPSILSGAVIMGLVFGLPAAEVVVAGGLALVQEKFLFLANFHVQRYHAGTRYRPGNGCGEWRNGSAFAAAVFLPFLVGLVAGNNVAFVGGDLSPADRPVQLSRHGGTACTLS